MSVDIVARGLALQARPVVVTATGVASISVPAAVEVIQTSGYSTAGKGMGLYVSDSLATSALAAAHPRFCKQSADGRYWRLSVEHGLNVLAGGAVADDATDDGPVFIAALAYLRALAVAGIGSIYSKGGYRLYAPSGSYYLATSTLDIAFPCIFRGEHSGPAGGATQLRWANNTTGIRTQWYNTSGASAHGAGDGIYATNTQIRDLFLYGGYNGSSESESHGIQLRSRALVENVTIYKFPGDGVHGNAGVGAETFRGNINSSVFRNVAAIECRDGFHFDGGDSHALRFYDCQEQLNRRWGRWHVQGIATLVCGSTNESNGYTGTLGLPTKCSHSGNRYSVLPDQEVWAAANAPTGTTANNQGWAYYGPGGTSAPEFPAWANAMALRAGGSGRFDIHGGVIVGEYMESDQVLYRIGEAAYTLIGFAGGATTLTGAPYGGRMYGGSGAMAFSKDIYVADKIVAYGDEMTFGDQVVANAKNCTINIDNGNAYSILNFRYGPSSTLAAQILSDNNSLFISGGAGGRLRQNGVDVASFTTAGLLVPMAGAKIGYDTGAGGAVTQITSRTTGVTLNKACGQITLVSAAGSASWQSFTVTNSVVAAGDTIEVSQKSGADKYMIHVTAVGAGSFEISFATTGGTTTEQPVFSFAVVKAVAA